MFRTGPCTAHCVHRCSTKTPKYVSQHDGFETIRTVSPGAFAPDRGGGVRRIPPGMATRVGVEQSAYNVPAHRLLEALINHTPSPDTIAREFLVELSKCGTSAVESLGSMFRSSTRVDLADHASKLKQCVAVLAPVLQVSGQ